MTTIWLSAVACLCAGVRVAFRYYCVCRVSVPEVVSTAHETKFIARNSYKLSIETDFDTIINTSLNKYTARSAVTSSMAGHHSTALVQCTTESPTVIFGDSASGGEMEFTECFTSKTTEESNLDARHDKGNQSCHMDLTFPTTQNLVEASLNFFEQSADKSENAAFVTGAQGSSAQEPDLIRSETNLLGHQPNVRLDTTSEKSDISQEKIDSNLFLKKLGNGKTCRSRTEDISTGPSQGDKINAKSFLSRFTSGTSAGVEQPEEVATRPRTTTEGSEEMEFTACVEQLVSGVQPVSEVVSNEKISTSEKNKFSPPVTAEKDVTSNFQEFGQTRIFSENDGNMELTSCISDVLRRRERELTMGGNDEIFHHLQEEKEIFFSYQKTLDKSKMFEMGENMEMTQCLTDQGISDGTSARDMEKTTLFETGENMEITGSGTNEGGPGKSEAMTVELSSVQSSRTNTSEVDHNKTARAGEKAVLPENPFVREAALSLAPAHDETKIFRDIEEDMDFTTCATEVNAPSINASLPKVDVNTCLLNSSECNMEMTYAGVASSSLVQATSDEKEDSDRNEDKQVPVGKSENGMVHTLPSEPRGHRIETSENGSSPKSFDEQPEESVDSNGKVDSVQGEISLVKLPPNSPTKGLRRKMEVLLQTAEQPNMATNINENGQTDTASVAGPEQSEGNKQTPDSMSVRKRSHPKVSSRIEDHTKEDIALSNGSSEKRSRKLCTRDSSPTSQEGQSQNTESPGHEQELTEGFKRLLSKVRAKRSIDPGNTNVFNFDTTLAQMDFTTCAGGIELFDKSLNTNGCLPQDHNKKVR